METRTKVEHYHGEVKKSIDPFTLMVTLSDGSRITEHEYEAGKSYSHRPPTDFTVFVGADQPNSAASKILAASRKAAEEWDIYWERKFRK
jgi:hypothetical protein